MRVRYKITQSLIETTNKLIKAKIYLNVKKEKNVYKVEAGIEHEDKKIKMLDDKIVVLHPSSYKTDLEIVDKNIMRLIVEGILLYTSSEDAKIPAIGTILYYPHKHFDKFYNYYTRQV